MKTVSIVHTKGGVGKTTTAIFLASAATRAGQNAVVVDSDPQGSATDWASVAAAGGTPLPFPVEPSGQPMPAHTDLRIIDTPPGTATAIQVAIDAADLVLVPTGATPLDIRRVFPTLEITAHRPTAVLLTRIDLRATLSATAREILDAAGVPVLETVVVSRQAIARQFGLPPDHLHGYDDIYREIEEVLNHV